MDISELVSRVKNKAPNQIPRYPEMVREIEEATRFLDEIYKDSVLLRHRVHCLSNSILNKVDIPLCSVCGLNPVSLVKEKKFFGNTCSSECLRKENGRKTAEAFAAKSREAIEAITEKRANTYFEKTGYTSHHQDPAIKEAKKQTFLAKYGVENPMQCSEIKEKQVSTVKTRMGVTNVSKHKKVKDKKHRTVVANYGMHNMQIPVPEESMKILQNREEISGMYKTQSANEIAAKLGVTPATVTNYLKKHGINIRSGYEVSRFHISDEASLILDDKESLKKLYDEFGGVKTADMLGVNNTTVYKYLQKYEIEVNSNITSAAERRLNEFIQSLGIDTITSDRSLLSGKEIDILIPSKKIAIEYNGIFWHSKKFKENTYHLKKSDEAAKHGYRTIHIFEDEWEYRTEQVKKKLASILGMDKSSPVFARKCSLERIAAPEVIKDFYEQNHIQGAGKQSLTFCLKHGSIIVAMVSFSKRTDTEYELSRYATSCRVVGGFSKLFKHASSVLRDMGVETVVSFADKRYSEGNVYIVNGWVHVKDTPPDYQYVIGSRRVRKQNFRRKFLRAKLENFDPALSEIQNMMNHGLYPIYDCGLMKFEFSLDWMR